MHEPKYATEHDLIQGLILETELCLTLGYWLAGVYSKDTAFHKKSFMIV